MDARHQIEVFTEGCSSCEGAVAYAHELASSSADYEVRVWDVKQPDGSRDRVVAVRTRSERLPCDAVVNAAGAWAGHVGSMVGLGIPVRPVRGQIVCTETLPPLLEACLSTADCYLAQKHHGEVIIGSTTEEVGFDPGVTSSAIQTLCAGAVRAVPALADVGVKRVWSGLRPGSPDELPILGPVDGLGGYLNACGHFRTGILTAPLTGLMLAEVIAGERPSYPLDPFLLSRFSSEPEEARQERPEHRHPQPAAGVR